MFLLTTNMVLIATLMCEQFELSAASCNSSFIILYLGMDQCLWQLELLLDLNFPAKSDYFVNSKISRNISYMSDNSCLFLKGITLFFFSEASITCQP